MSDNTHSNAMIEPSHPSPYSHLIPSIPFHSFTICRSSMLFHDTSLWMPSDITVRQGHHNQNESGMTAWHTIQHEIKSNHMHDIGGNTHMNTDRNRRRKDEMRHNIYRDRKDSDIDGTLWLCDTCFLDGCWWWG